MKLTAEMKGNAVSDAALPSMNTEHKHRKAGERYGINRCTNRY